MKISRSKHRCTLYGLFAILLWSMTVALARSLAEQIGALTAGAAIYLTGGLLSLAWTRRPQRSRPGPGRQSPWYLLGCGALFVGYTLALFMAIGLGADRLQVLEIGLINYLWPSLTIWFSLFLLNKKAGLWLVPATLLGLLGIFLVLTQGAVVSWRSFAGNLGGNPRAYALALAAAVAWGLYSNLARRWADPRREGGVPLFMLTTGLVLLPLRLWRPEAGAWGLRTLAELLVMSLSTAFAYVFWDIAMRKGDVVLVASASYFTPLLSTLVSCIYLGLMPGLNLWLGCLLIVAGSLLSWASVADRGSDSG